MRRVFKTRHFARWMRKTTLMDAALCEAVRDMVSGLIKKRVAVEDGALQEICHAC